MNSILKNATLFVAMAALTAGMASCSKDDDTSNANPYDEQAAAIAAQFVDHTVAPTYTALAAKTEQLADKLAELKTNPSDAGVREACTLFLEARAEWEKSEAFLFGAAGDFGIDPHIDSWPFDVTAFNAQINNQSMIARLDAVDGDAIAGAELGNSNLGFHSIEYILFADGQPKSASAITANEWIYVVAVAGDLRNNCYRLEVSWVGDAAPASHIEKLNDLEVSYTIGGSDYSYGENMKQAGNAGSTYPSRLSALMAIVDGSKTIADEVGTSKIGSAYSGEDPTYIESPYSKQSKVDFYNNIISIQNAYMGGIEGQRDESRSLHTFVKNQNANLDAQVVEAIGNALAKIDAMPVFVDNITDPRNGEAMEACQAVDEILSQVNEMLRSL